MRKTLNLLVLIATFAFWGCAIQKPTLIVNQDPSKAGSYNLKYKSSYSKEVSAGHLFWNASKLTLENGYEYFLPAFSAYNQKRHTSSVLIFMSKGTAPEGSTYIYAKPLMAYLKKVKVKMPLQKENPVVKFDNDLNQYVGGMNLPPK